MSGNAEVARPIPTGASKATVHQFAESVGRQLKLTPGDALEPVVGRLGGQIVYHSPVGFDAPAPESIVVRSMRDFTIFIPSTTSIERDRFTVSHELGHLFLHYPMVQKSSPGAPMVATRWVDNTDTSQQRAEWEANWFAAAFLMPEADFRSAWTREGGRLSRLAASFCVSEQAATVRAKSLALA